MTQLLEAKDIDRLQIKIKDFLIRGYKAEGSIYRDPKTKMYMQKMTKDKKDVEKTDQI